MAKKYDPEMARTISVITKCDAFSSTEDKLNVKKLIIAQKNEKLGAHAICCRIKGLPTTDDEEAVELYKQFEGQIKHTGIPELRD